MQILRCWPHLPYPGYQRFFSRAVGIFGVGRRPTHLRNLPFQTPARLRFSCCPVGQSQPYKDLTATGNRARKVSGTQGTFTVVFRSWTYDDHVIIVSLVCWKNRCFLQRIFAEFGDIRFCITNTDDHVIMVWLVWSIKDWVCTEQTNK